jgi:hypothetical protein
MISQRRRPGRQVILSRSSTFTKRDQFSDRTSSDRLAINLNVQYATEEAGILRLRNGHLLKSIGVLYKTLFQVDIVQHCRSVETTRSYLNQMHSYIRL